MKAKDVMTSKVVTASPETTVEDIAKTLLKRRISAVPIVDENDRLVGIVSEGDLIRRADLGTGDHPRSWWLSLFSGSADLAADYAKSRGHLARDVMTRETVTVSEETDLSEIAELLEKNHIKRVPVVRDSRLVGIVSRANLLQGLAAAKAKAHVPVEADDSEIRRQVSDALREQPWASIGTTNVTVTDGVVEFWGTVGSPEERDASRVAAESVPGVKEVVDHRALHTAVPSGL